MPRPLPQLLLAHCQEPVLAGIVSIAAALPAHVVPLTLPQKLSSLSPDEEATTLQAFLSVARRLQAQAPLIIGGFSMGGTIAALAAPSLDIRGLLCWGFPFHRYGAPQERHGLLALQAVSAPTLILQGTRDPHGNQQAIAGYRDLASNISIHWLQGCKHRFGSGPLLDNALTSVGPFLTRLLVSPST